MRILVVEDDRLLNNTLCYNLDTAGYAVDSALTKSAASNFLTKQDYDLIVTGDLGALGKKIVLDQFQRVGVDLTPVYDDCGVLIYDPKRQDVHAGGSGCGCGASVLCGYLLDRLEKRELRRLRERPLLRRERRQEPGPLRRASGTHMRRPLCRWRRRWPGTGPRRRLHRTWQAGCRLRWIRIRTPPCRSRR